MKEKKCSWEAFCTWGDGPDILLVHRKNDFEVSSYDLNIKEARSLAYELIIAADQAENIEESVKDYFEQIDKKTLNIIKKF